MDLDRTFGFQWSPSRFRNGRALLENPCSEEYAGPKEFSANETTAFADYVKRIKPTVYIDLHSYSQVVLYPFEYSCDAIPDDAENLAELAWGAAKAVRGVNGRFYNVEQACENDSSASQGRAAKQPVSSLKTQQGGSALDWVYKQGKVQWSYSVKLRDNGQHGFLLPHDQIIPTGEEIWALTQYVAQFVENPNY